MIPPNRIKSDTPLLAYLKTPQFALGLLLASLHAAIQAGFVRHAGWVIFFEEIKPELVTLWGILTAMWNPPRATWDKKQRLENAAQQLVEAGWLPKDWTPNGVGGEGNTGGNG